MRRPLWPTLAPRWALGIPEGPQEGPRNPELIHVSVAISHRVALENSVPPGAPRPGQMGAFLAPLPVFTGIRLEEEAVPIQN